MTFKPHSSDIEKKVEAWIVVGGVTQPYDLKFNKKDAEHSLRFDRRYGHDAKMYPCVVTFYQPPEES